MLTQGLALKNTEQEDRGVDNFVKRVGRGWPISIAQTCAPSHATLVCHPPDGQIEPGGLASPETGEAEMGRFYFHLRSGDQVIADQEGSELPDVTAARLEALAAARYILADAIRSGNENIPEAFVIADSEGRELDTVPLAAVLPKSLS
jgi:hypothetical protein